MGCSGASGAPRTRHQDPMKVSDSSPLLAAFFSADGLPPFLYTVDMQPSAER